MEWQAVLTLIGTSTNLVIDGMLQSQLGVNLGLFELANHQRCLVEVVLGQEFPALGKTIRESKFRTRFNAAILSLSREGKRVPGKLGAITFQMGDTLLLEASKEFAEQYRFRRDFLLVSALNDSTPPDFNRARRSVDLPLRC